MREVRAQRRQDLVFIPTDIVSFPGGKPYLLSPAEKLNVALNIIKLQYYYSVARYLYVGRSRSLCTSFMIDPGLDQAEPVLDYRKTIQVPLENIGGMCDGKIYPMLRRT